MSRFQILLEWEAPVLAPGDELQDYVIAGLLEGIIVEPQTGRMSRLVDKLKSDEDYAFTVVARYKTKYSPSIPSFVTASTVPLREYLFLGEMSSITA